jgi:hypothetical protein
MFVHRDGANEAIVARLKTKVAVASQYPNHKTRAAST